VLHSSQHGFRVKHNTTTALTEVLDSVTTALNNKYLSIALFLDISKAFDSLNHQLLLNKLRVYGVRGVALKLMESYFTNRFQCTVINNVCSEYRTISMGVPQGSILGPLMYVVFVNDIFNISHSVKCVLYADDTVIIVSGKTMYGLHLLAQYYFSLFSRWFALNNLCLNDSKTHFVIFGYNDNKYNVLMFDNHIVQRVSNVRYLGIIIDEKLSWKLHIDSVCKKLSKGIGMMKKCYSIFPKHCLLTIYYSFILPHLQYGVEFWGSTCTTYLQPLRVLQKQCIRLICHVNKLTHSVPLAYNLGLLLFDELFIFSLACFMFKVNSNLAPDVICNMFTKTSTVHKHATRSHSVCFFVPRCNNSIRLNFITYKGVICWNALPSDITNTFSYSKFKHSLRVNLSANYLL